MTRFNVYSTRFGDVHRNVRGGVTGLPGWGRFIVMLAALPGLTLLALAIFTGLLAVAVLILTAGVAFWLVMKVQTLLTGSNEEQATRRPNSKRIDATVLDPE